MRRFLIDVTGHLSPSCLANVARLHAYRDPMAVLCVGEYAEALARGFEAWAGSVVGHPTAEAARESAPERASFDLTVVLCDEALPHLAPLREISASAGLFLVGSRRLGARRLERACDRAGLRRELTYRVSPSMDRPLYLVPDAPHAWPSYLEVRAPLGGLAGALRTLGLLLGRPPRDHRDGLVVARAP